MRKIHPSILALVCVFTAFAAGYTACIPAIWNNYPVRCGFGVAIIVFYTIGFVLSLIGASRA